MPFKYSEQLRLELIKYFKEKHNHEVSHEEADEYLDSLGSLFESMISFTRAKG